MKRSLGSLERALVIADRHAPFHVVTALQLENPPPPEVLERALESLQRQHPFLCARLSAGDDRIHFEDLGSPSLPMDTRPREDGAHWSEVVERELQTRLDVSAGPMFRCTYLYSDTAAEIVLTFFHPIIDAASAIQLMHELLSSCADLMHRGHVAGSRAEAAPPVEERFPTAYRGFRLKLLILRYALGQVWDELGYRLRTRGRRTPPVRDQAGAGRILSTRLSERTTAALALQVRREGVTLNSTINAAIMLAVNRHLYSGLRVPMRTFTFANLRPYVVPPLGPEQLACYFSMMRYTLYVAGQMDFWRLARDLHRRMYTSFKAGDKFAACVMAEPLMRMVTRSRSFRMGSTALNYTGMVPLRTQYGRILVKGIHGFISAFDLGPEFSGEAQIFDDRLCLDFMYLEADMSRDLAERIVAEIHAILNAALASEADPATPNSDAGGGTR